MLCSLHDSRFIMLQINIKRAFVVVLLIINYCAQEDSGYFRGIHFGALEDQ